MSFMPTQEAVPARGETEGLPVEGIGCGLAVVVWYTNLSELAAVRQ